MSYAKPDYAHALEVQRFLHEAIRRRSAWHIKEAAAFCERDDKTIRRWADALKEAYRTDDGRPGIDRIKKGRQTFIVAEPSAFRVQPELYDYASLSLALQMVDFAKDSQLAGGLRNLKTDMERSLRLNPKLLGGLGKRLYVRHAGPRIETNGEALDELISGLVHTRRVRVLYGDWRTPKVLEPLTLAIFQEGVYVWVRLAEDHKKVFTLAAQRIRQAELLGVKERFEYPADWDLEHVFATRFGFLPGDKVVKAAIRFAPHVAPYIRERLWHRSQKIETLRDGSLRLRLEVEDAPDFVAWICSFGDEAKVESPQSLRAQVVQRLRRALRAYGR